MTEQLDPQVQIRIIDLAEKVANASLPDTPKGEAGLNKYLEYIDKAYKGVLKTIALT